MKKTPACDPMPAPASGRDRSLYVVSTVIVVCLVTLALGLYFTTTDRSRPTSTAVATAATPAPRETTSSTTTKIPDIPGTIICFAQAQNVDMKEDMKRLKDLCQKFVLIIEFDEDGNTDTDIKSLDPMKNHLGKQFLTGITMPENYQRSRFESVAKNSVWNTSVSHGITQIHLTKQTSQILKNLAATLQNIYVITILAESSDVDSTVSTTAFIPGLEVIAIASICEASPWNESDVLALANGIKSKVKTAIALSFSAAIWEGFPQYRQGKKDCSGWGETTDVLMGCVKTQPLQQCRKESSVFVDNRTISAMVKYAKSKDINAFAIRNGEKLFATLPLHRQFHLLKFRLPLRQGVPVKDTLRRSIQRRQHGAHNWASSEPGGKTVELSPGSEVEQVQTEVTVMAAEHHGKSGVVKKASKPADSTTHIPVVAWARGSSSSPTAGTGRCGTTPQTTKVIKEASAPSTDMASSTTSVNDEEATLTA